MTFLRLCAHRGLSKACPENTLPAFGAAIAIGVHEIEFDLWLSRDGVAVSCHDPAVNRTTDGVGELSELDWADIRRLDAGIRWGDAWRGVRIPRMEEVFDVASHKVGLNIHVKESNHDGRLVRTVADLIRARGLVDSAYIAGSTEEVLQMARDYAPEVRRACLVSQDAPVRQIEIATGFACARVQLRRHVKEEEIRLAHDAGLLCNLFYSDDVDEAVAFGDRGIDVVLTNCAHQLMRRSSR